MLKKCLFLTVIFFLTIFELSAAPSIQKNKDVRLSEIDNLIRRTEYDKALELLNVYIANNPDGFDNAQFRIKSIIKARMEYSKLADRLIQIIVNEPENNKKIYEIIAQLEKYEKHPSDANLQFIADVKRSAQFNYFRAVFMELQTEAAGLTLATSYVSAIEKIREGFWLYKDDFYEKWEEKPEFTSKADGILNDLEKNLTAFESRDYILKLNDSVQKFIQHVNADSYKDAVSAFNEVQKHFADLNALYVKIKKNASDFDELFAKTRAVDSDFTDASYLPFMIRFINGIDLIQNSGITGVMDGLWDNLCTRMNDAVFDQLTAKYNLYLMALKGEEKGKKNLTQEQTSFDAASSSMNYAVMEKKVIALYDMKSGMHEEENPLAGYGIMCAYLARLVNETQNLRTAQHQVSLIQTEQEELIKTLAEEKNKAELIQKLFAVSERVAAVTGLKSEKDLNVCEWAKPYNENGFKEWKRLSEYYSELVDSVFAQAQTIDYSTWLQISQFYRGLTDSYVADARDFNTSGNFYYEGLKQRIPGKTLNDFRKNAPAANDYAKTQRESEQELEDDFGIIYCYPDVAKTLFNFNSSQIDDFVNKTNEHNTLLQDFYQKNPNWHDKDEMNQVEAENQRYFEANIELLLGLKNACTEELALCEQKIILAKVSRNEGDIRYDEAEGAYKKQDYALARKKLQDSLSKYDESLSNQDDDDLRLLCDKRLSELAAKITRAENEVVVVEVRNLKTLAKDAYFNGRFDDAERYLNQARIRWADTNVTEDEEILNLMTFVNTAVSMNTGREILPSYPQYPEMSQLLDIAYQYYDSGSHRYSKGNYKEGDADLDRALQSIQKVQYVYPLNQEASLLTLKINKLKDPEKFREEFKQKIDAAKFMCQGKETRREGYANLLDYYQLEPDYPGLKDLIYQTEIEIGIRKKPVEVSEKKQARNLYSQAKTAFSSAGNDRTKLNAVLAKINESLALNADDKDAMKLKDQVMTRIGGSASTVLSTEDERLYQLAIQRLQNNNISGANAIVSKLLQKPENSNSQKIKDLKVKIDARS